MTRLEREPALEALAGTLGETARGEGRVDLVPKGRDEDGLSYPTEWLRHHDRYQAAPLIPAKDL